jgi:signal transduction histidine kinase
MVRRLRWRLVAWSAGSTLAVFVVLGAAVYAVTATALAGAAEAQLRQRAGAMVSSGAGTVIAGSGSATIAVTSPDGASAGLAFGGPFSGTLAVVLPAAGAVSVPSAGGAPLPSADGIVPQLPAGAAPLDVSGFEAAAAGASVIHLVSLDGTPVRVLSEPVGSGPVLAVVQVAADRNAEDRTLTTLLLVLLVGGLAVFVVSGALGYAYAARAVAPIRVSMRRQRELAADTSHELRTPLAIISGSIEDLRRHQDQPVGEVGDALDDLETEVAHVGQLVDDLLLLARTDAGTMDVAREAMDLSDAAADALGGLARLAADHAIGLELDAEPAPILGDAVRLRRLVTILVDNAIRHGRPVGGDPGTVRVVVRPGASLEVQDDGPGIRPEDRSHVFDRFWRAPEAGPGGSGLGLAIAAWIVERHDGRITVLARPDGGTTFRVELPGV